MAIKGGLRTKDRFTAWGLFSLLPFALSAVRERNSYLIYFSIAPTVEQSRVKYAPCLVSLNIIKIGNPFTTLSGKLLGHL